MRNILALLLFTSMALGVALGAINLEVPLEMVDVGIASSDAASTIFERTRMGLDTGDYDGATYYLECVCENDDGSDRLLSILNSAGSSVGNVNITSATTTRSRVRAASPFTPTAGANNYRVQLEQTTSAATFHAYAVRIIVVQVSATKTRIQIPLTSGPDNTSDANDTAGQVDTTTSSSYTQGNLNKFPLWRRTASNWATVSGMSIETVQAPASAAQSSQVAVFNYTDGTEVTHGAVSHTGSTVPTLKSADFATSATNFDDGDDFEVRFKTGGAGTARLHRAALYVELGTSATKVETYWRFQRQTAAATNLERNSQRVLLNTGAFDDPVIYFDATLDETAAGDRTWNLTDCSTSDVNLSCTPVTSANHTTDSTTNVYLRSSALTITSGNRFIAETTGASGTMLIVHGVAVITSTTPPAAGTSYIGVGVSR